MSDADWKATQGRLHGLLGQIYFSQGKMPDAGNEFLEFLKTSPSDGLGQYRYGMATYTQLQQTLANLQALNTEAQAAKARGEDVSAYADRLTEKNNLFLTQRDVTIDAMAKAYAIGGPFAADARKIIEPLFKQKNGSLDGLDPFITSKRAELAALTPLPAPSVGIRGGAPAVAGAGTPGTGGGGGGGRGGR
jgi:hypothetical protein